MRFYPVTQDLWWRAKPLFDKRGSAIVSTRSGAQHCNRRKGRPATNFPGRDEVTSGSAVGLRVINTAYSPLPILTSHHVKTEAQAFEASGVRFEPQRSHAAVWLPCKRAARLRCKTCIAVLVAGPLQIWRNSFRNDLLRVPLATESMKNDTCRYQGRKSTRPREGRAAGYERVEGAAPFRT